MGRWLQAGRGRVRPRATGLAAIGAAAVAAAGAVAPAPASAAISSPPDPLLYFRAMSELPVVAEENTSAFPSGYLGPPSGAVGISSGDLAGFPRQGSSFVILTNGLAASADDANSPGETGFDHDHQAAAPPNGPPTNGAAVYDFARFENTFRVPRKPNCLSIDFRFLSDEFGESHDPPLGDDTFLAELVGFGGSAYYPSSFSFGPDGPITPDTGFGLSAEAAAGTSYDGATPRLRAMVPVTPEALEMLILSIFDQGDGSIDSAVFLDRLVLEKNPDCVAGSGLPIPTTKILDGPPAKTTRRAAKFSFSSPSDPESSFECSLDGAEFAACPSPTRYTDLARGNHLFKVRAVLDGRADLSPAKRAWKIVR